MTYIAFGKFELLIFDLSSRRLILFNLANGIICELNAVNYIKMHLWNHLYKNLVNFRLVVFITTAKTGGIPG